MCRSSDLDGEAVTNLSEIRPVYEASRMSQLRKSSSAVSQSSRLRLGLSQPRPRIRAGARCCASPSGRLVSSIRQVHNLLDPVRLNASRAKTSSNTSLRNALTLCDDLLATPARPTYSDGIHGAMPSAAEPLVPFDVLACPRCGGRLRLVAHRRRGQKGPFYFALTLRLGGLTHRLSFVTVGPLHAPWKMDFSFLSPRREKRPPPRA